MDIKQLKFLVALEQTRHFGQAAARCHVTQPTLSMRIRDLEAELGLELIRRSHRFEGFTEAGLRVLAWARTLLAAEEGLHAEAAACRGQLVGTLRLGVVPLAGFDPMNLVGLFAELHPSLRFVVSVLSSEQIYERLGRNQLDLGISYLERLDRVLFDAYPLTEVHMGLLHDPRRFSFAAPVLGWPALAELPLGLLSTGMHFRQSIDHGFRRHGLTPNLRLETDAVYLLVRAVGAGLCCGIVPLEGGFERESEHLQLIPIEDARTLAPLGLIIRRAAPRSPLAEACFREAKAFFRTPH